MHATMYVLIRAECHAHIFVGRKKIHTCLYGVWIDLQIYMLCCMHLSANAAVMCCPRELSADIIVKPWKVIVCYL